MSLGDIASSAFNWLANNPEFTADLLVGVGTGIATYYAQKEEREMLREMEERRRPKYASMENYTGRLDGEGGLLTQDIWADLTWPKRDNSLLKNGLLARQVR